jgi:hypothetical protein
MFPTRALERREHGAWILIETASTPDGHRRLANLHAAWSDLFPHHRYRVVERSHLKGAEDRVVLP